MDLLKKKILQDGKVLSPSILKVDSFLNHCIDPVLMDEMGKSFANYFADSGITKVMTIESGGIAPALTTAFHLGVPVLFAKKAKPSTMRDPLSATVHSYTKDIDYTLCVESSLLSKDDTVLFIDDFLANGQAFLGIRSLLEQKGARLGGIGICIEKAWQNGRSVIEQTGVPCGALASISSMSEEGITWNTDNEIA